MPEAAPLEGLWEGSLVPSGLPTALRSYLRGSASTGGSGQVPPTSVASCLHPTPPPKHCTGGLSSLPGWERGWDSGSSGICPLSTSLWPIPEPVSSTYPEWSHHTRPTNVLLPGGEGSVRQPTSVLQVSPSCS